MRSTILVVDDSPVIIQVVSGILEDYHIKFAMNGKDALRIIRDSDDLDLILLDIEMPGMDGYELLEHLNAEFPTKQVPVIYLTVKDAVDEEIRGISLGAVDYIKKPINRGILKARVDTHIRLKSVQQDLDKQNELLESKVINRTRELQLTRDFTIKAMMSLLELRDIESGHHIARTQLYVKEMCQYLQENSPYKHQLPYDKIQLIFRTAPLHDIGKVAIPDPILLKPGKLNDEEFEHMKLHTNYAIEAFSNVDDLLGDYNYLNMVKEIAGSHHEKWDGSGYPYGLIGEAIPLSGRIMAIADVYDALVSKRVYKPAFSHQYAVESILDGKGSHFDPVLVNAFSALHERFDSIYGEYTD